MKLHTLKPAPGAIKARKRIARGQGSGTGGTATRGHKGAQSRSGYSQKRGFEGGQMPLQRRLPIFGFKNVNRKVYKPINLDILQHLAEHKNETTIDVTVLMKHGLGSKHDRFKILGNGKLTAKINVSAHAFSASARGVIEQCGGVATCL